MCRLDDAIESDLGAWRLCKKFWFFDTPESGRVVQESLVPWYLEVVQEYSVLSEKEDKAYRCTEGGGW